ncbi:hypothetical protein HYDPIDRAFT_156657 [Hydnomerulius pinastri MD-312]|uniref:DUF6533 domain-containing protein n=1 Tax=Hydnomerulius pinastri MD-312 TaxID=994086 RepID=A0A0C9W7J7_9AGAM|nr:hypothetical protein HYDPIDRAFT_156657 [Hydnomerulius pinastri MD-312]
MIPRAVDVVDSVSTEKYLRIASISIALYDYFLTLPAEWRFYRSQTHIFHLSLACILFILIRYSSILVIVVSNYGVFATSFTEESCRRYYLIAPIFKVIQTMVSQVILGVRTFNITRRNRRMGIALAIFILIATVLEWFTNMYNRIRKYFQSRRSIACLTFHSCTPANSGSHLSAWFYYLIAMLYDFGTLTVSTFYLTRYSTGLITDLPDWSERKHSLCTASFAGLMSGNH